MGMRRRIILNFRNKESLPDWELELRRERISIEGQRPASSQPGPAARELGFRMDREGCGSGQTPHLVTDFQSFGIGDRFSDGVAMACFGRSLGPDNLLSSTIPAWVS